MIASAPELLRRYGLSARHSWGQNFLHDPTVHRSIAAATGARPGRRVIEIGAGLGSLTWPLIETGAEIWGIERDRDLCQVLRAELGEYSNFKLIEADAVHFDYAAAAAGCEEPPTIVGNLPYQLTGPLLFALLAVHRQTGPWIVMIQREVADRLCASPGSRTYGGVTVMLSRVRRISLVTQVPRACFVPRPRVDSTVIRLDPLPQLRGEVADEEGLRRLVQAAFQRRRKVLVNALGGVATREQAYAWCERAGIDPKIRPERLGPEEFAALQRAREAEVSNSAGLAGTGPRNESAGRHAVEDESGESTSGKQKRAGGGAGGGISKGKERAGGGSGGGISKEKERAGGGSGGGTSKEKERAGGGSVGATNEEKKRGAGAS
ncbi:MAG TPA: ribosomal RNA small subunit methyltransferase A [Nannocystis exedens]|nr:ribosomal RNA small subunit methyltransferase A [Nannocystis exedens]